MHKTKLMMDTVVTIRVAAPASGRERAEERIGRAFEAFRQVERACSRFSPDSELLAACRRVGTPVPVSPFLYEPLKFALAVAEWTGGLFDPTVGRTMEERGFNRHYLTGVSVAHPAAENASYRDVELREEGRSLLLRKPLVIDLGAVAKGFAIDLAAQELREFPGFLINAGGDLYAGGTDGSGAPWTVGIRHPGRKDEVYRTLELSDEAICTSGSYERRSSRDADEHHIVDPSTGRSPGEWVSCSVIAPFAMMADAFSTAAFLMDAGRAKALLEQAGLKAVMIAADLSSTTLGGL